MSELESMQSHSQEEQIYRALLLEKTPMIDLRAPVEFSQGAFPESYNLPLMTDSEREQVGTCYKNSGQQAAIALGYQLVASDIQNRIDKWAQFKQTNPTAWLYCFRGGLRSRLSAQFLKDNGVDINIVPGGYKALRGYLLGIIEKAAQQKLTIVGGNTGCGKTHLIQSLDNGVDLEGRANHRGSSFGKQVTEQPRQISFENQLGVDILNISQHTDSFIIEDESRAIGALSVPHPLLVTMKFAPLVVVDDPLDVRLQRLCYEYCTLMAEKFIQAHGAEQGWQAYAQYLHRGLYGIRKRLGSEKLTQLSKGLDEALLQQQNSGNADAHLNWIAPILSSYYDPMYLYQLKQKAERVEFRGTFAEVKEWLMVNKK